MLWLFVTDIRDRDDVNLLAKMIERENTIEKHQEAIGNFKIFTRLFGQFLELAHSIVGNESNRPTIERRKIGQGGETMFPKQLCENVKQLSLAALGRSSFSERDLLSAALKHHVRTNAEKGVTSNSFTALHRFQQKRFLFSRRNTQKRRYRSQQIRHHRLYDGD